MNTLQRSAVLTAAALVSLNLAAQVPPVASETAAVNMPVPAVIHSLQARQVVEQIIAQRHDLLLSDNQFEELLALQRAVTEERAIYEPTGRSKPPYERPVWVTTPEQALERAFTVLTPQQRHKSLMLFAQEGRVQ